jgi:hypothetical protein
MLPEIPENISVAIFTVIALSGFGSPSIDLAVDGI